MEEYQDPLIQNICNIKSSLPCSKEISSRWNKQIGTASGFVGQLCDVDPEIVAF